MVQLPKNASAGPSGSRDSFGGGLSHESNTMRLDLASSQVILQLILDDIEEIKAGRKGKARDDAPQTDQEYALQLQSETTRAALQVANDAALAASIGQALMTDRECLMAVAVSEQAAIHDRRAAVALSKGQKMPEISRCQKWVEDQKSFGLPSTESPSPPPSYSSSDSFVEIEGPLKELKETPKEIQCASCRDHFSDGEDWLQLPCAHTFCPSCVVALVKACTQDETLFPLKCCNKPIDPAAVTHYINNDLRLLFAAKTIEFGTPTATRLYCPSAKCSAFIPGSAKASGILTVACQKCHLVACSGCKQAAHPGDNCAENVVTLQVREMAKKEQWQTCPGCKAIIELRQGCYHIVCRCGTQFCYVCGAAWKTCRCQTAEENRLYARS